MRLMKYEELIGKSVLLLGKTRSLHRDEFETLLKLHTIEVKATFEEDIALIIEGRMMNPLEQDEAARLYHVESIPIVEISDVERWLCGSIDPNRLLMSLKLSRDHERLVNFIQNPYITDELFFKLLKLYDWQGEGLFDTNTNRDVTAAVIGRFYADLGRNHNVQYAMSGLAHLIERYGTASLITAIAELSPIHREIKQPYERALKGVLDAIALHRDTPKTLLKQLISTRAKLLAHREPLGVEEELLALNDSEINPLLACNPSLSPQGADTLEPTYPEAIASYYPLDEVRFERLMNFVIPCDDTESTIRGDGSRIKYGMTEDENGMRVIVSLASNNTLTASMQKRLMEMNNEAVFSQLAQNTTLLAEHVDTLFAMNRYGTQLASNTSLATQQLEVLYQRANSEISMALASNPSTPIDILYQLSLDRRYERRVQTNPTFGAHIQTHNIGWHS